MEPVGSLQNDDEAMKGTGFELAVFRLLHKWDAA